MAGTKSLAADASVFWVIWALGSDQAPFGRYAQGLRFGFAVMVCGVYS